MFPGKALDGSGVEEFSSSMNGAVGDDGLFPFRDGTRSASKNGESREKERFGNSLLN
jgi:hypothetical protein